MSYGRRVRDRDRDRKRNLGPDRGQVAIEYLGFLPILLLVAVALIVVLPLRAVLGSSREATG